MSEQLPLPCAFCGSEMREDNVGGTVIYRHPTGVACFLYECGHRSIRTYNIDSWNARATVVGAPVCYEVLDGIPVFNSGGRGRPADASFLNRCFGFLLEHWKNNSK